MLFSLMDDYFSSLEIDFILESEGLENVGIASFGL